MHKSEPRKIAVVLGLAFVIVGLAILVAMVAQRSVDPAQPLAPPAATTPPAGDQPAMANAPPPTQAESEVAAPAAPSAEVEPPRHNVRGIVLANDGSVIEGAHLRVSCNDCDVPGWSRHERHDLEVRADGTFLASDLPAGKFRFLASSPTHFSRSVVLQVPTQTPVEFRLEQGCLIRGRASRADRGLPLANTKIRYRIAPRGKAGSRFSAIDTDGEGQFALGPLRPGSWTVTFRHENFRSFTRTVDLRLGEPAAPLDVAFEFGVSVSGVVFNAAGTRLPATELLWQQRGNPATALLRCVADLEGRFELAGLSPGVWEVSPLDFGTKIERHIPVTLFDDPVQEVDVHLDCSEPLSVLVIDAEERPVAGAKVSFEYELPNSGGAGGARDTATTGDDGRTSISCLPAGAQLVVKATKRGVGQARIADHVVSETGDTVALVLRPPSVLRIAGRVLGEDSKPAAGIPVFAGSSGGVCHGRGVTNADGAFQFSVVAGTYPIQAEGGVLGAARYGPVTITDQPVDGLELKLSTVGSIRVQVVGADGEPLERARVELAREGGPRHQVRGITNADGWVGLAVEDGTYVVKARHDRLVQFEATRGVIPSGAPVKVVLEPPAARSIRGTVLHHGRPVPGARVGYHSPESSWVNDGGAVWSDAKGQFTLVGVRAETVVVHAWGEGFAFAVSQVLRLPRRGVTEDVAVSSRVGVPCTLVAKTAAGELLRDSAVVIRGVEPGPRAFLWKGTTDRDGRVDVPLLPIGDYQIEAGGRRAKRWPLSWGENSAAPVLVEVQAK